MMKRILCIGDSNTYGYDPRSYFGSQYPDDVRWTGLLEQAGWKVFNCGQNGLSIPEEIEFPVIRRLIRSRLPVDTITVMLGSNDLLGGATAEETVRCMERFLPCVIQEAPDTKVFMICPPVMQKGEWVRSGLTIRESVKLAELYRGLAKRLGIEYADSGEWEIELTCDGVHFSQAGHAVFAKKLLDLIVDC